MDRIKIKVKIVFSPKEIRHWECDTPNCQGNISKTFVISYFRACLKVYENSRHQEEHPYRDLNETSQSTTVVCLKVISTERHPV